MAAYGAQINEGKSPTEAQDFLKTAARARRRPAGQRRDALTTFTSGKGDVLLSYENEAIAAQKAGEDVDYVIPDDTILIETPIATTTDALDAGAGLRRLPVHDEAQQLWADAGYRPVVKSVFDKNKAKFPTPPGLFTIDDLGGWDKVNSEFFDPESSIVQEIEQDLGSR